jgi:AcrR family transcriptional regulator
MPQKAPERPARRVPAQERSRRRYETIVEVAGQLFAEQGFEGSTMEEIAARAHTSIGSLYQFFSDKLDVFRAVAERCLDRSRGLFSQLTAAGERLSWEEMLDRAVDAFFTLHREDPAYRAIWTNLQLYGEYAEADEALMRELSQASAALMALWRPDLPERKRRLVGRMVVGTVSSLLLMSARESDAAARDLVAETKLMLRAYLARHLPPTANPRGRARSRV